MSSMPLADWDVRIAPLLTKLEIDAQWTAHYCRSIRETVERMEAVPDWPTRAQNDVAKVREDLLAALRHLDKALLHYGRKALTE